MSGLKVIGAGFGRTGTASLKAALEELGFGPCYHMTEIFRHPEHTTTWVAAWRGETVDWDAFLGGYGATVDWPACTFYEELVRRYPDAKVILSVRDPERWYESTRDTIYELSKITAHSLLFRAIYAATSLLTSGKLASGSVVDEIVWEGTFDGHFDDKPCAIGVFERHNEAVKRNVPADNLLVYEVKEGWAPLSEFLGVEPPDKPFPHLNDAAVMRRRILALRTLSFAAPAGLALLAGGLYLALSRRSHDR